MSQPREILSAVETIYDAGTDPEQWESALGAVSALIDARVGLMAIVRPPLFAAEAAYGVDSSFNQHMMNLMDHNIWYHRHHLAPPGIAMAGEQLASNDEVKRTHLYSELLQPTDLLHLCGVTILDRDGLFGATIWLRSERQGSFSRRELDVLDALAPHISKAGNIACRLQEVNLYTAGLEASLNRLAHGFLLLDGFGRVLFANSEAERLLAAGRLARGCGGRLSGGTGAAEQSLDDFIRRLIILKEASAVQIPGEAGQGLKLIGAPLPMRRRDFTCLAAVAESMIFVFDEAADPPSPIRLIAEIYGLTPAESRLAEALMAGQTLADYGDLSQLTRNTLKTQLRSLFEKTDTKRQSDLIRSLARFYSLRL